MSIVSRLAWLHHRAACLMLFPTEIVAPVAPIPLVPAAEIRQKYVALYIWPISAP